MSAPTWLTTFLRTFQRAFAIAVVIAQGGIAVTGSIVRVTGSGLGCPTWPQCFEGSLTPVEHPEVASLHQWVEFGNRTLTGLVGFIAALCVLAAWFNRPRRKRVLVLALVQLGGVAAQAVIGGITVLTGLLWWTVSVHFLVSMLLVWFAVLLVAALGEGDGPATPLVPKPLMTLQVVQAVVLGLLLLAGTFVTAAGPHAGDAATPRLDAPVETVSQVHADLLFLFLGMLIALGFALKGHPVPRRPYAVLVAVVVAQGALGLVQYWTGVPEVLVSLHVLGAGAVVVATAALWVSTRVRGDYLVEGEGLRSHSGGSSVASHV
ncbi:COX15/CtaA family protein [Saccharothrix coeruleofusca]|uniref:Cytochrome-c oxidase n=1 Tax=Saccharothrix coeruleofusca TaxID=33919 RepID=A0A918EFL5_9PSEU|nr:COX15/CtaA family protein [Saccharothrix coeruleofusca]MBP2337756.1 cytochrome c oxidase assembly protein subunit 15 [Saccharothrix coeruleofusca]GGP62067.1 cytochrome-c oxidase [Saccharothrix coeruleofusca]